MVTHFIVFIECFVELCVEEVGGFDLAVFYGISFRLDLAKIRFLVQYRLCTSSDLLS